jgi:4-pyridoxate dehydrogenase
MSVKTGYDYVIVGGGSAGCVLAGRLSEDGAASVLLIEAGGRDLNPLIHIPLGMGKMHEYDMFNWGYHTEPEPNMNGRRIEAMRGKVLGGSSSINVMAYTRGNRGDYDRWAQKGARGWSYADVLPYFKRCETWQDGADPWRGGAGPVGTEFAKTRDPLYDAWLAAAKAAGFPVTEDYNGRQQEGFGRGQYTIRDGYRSSAATAYLRPARSRKNLDVETGAHATRVLMQGTRATGVEYVKGSGDVVRADASREVILAGGAFNTPQLLMLSGIGDPSHLREIGIETRVNLPGVGSNLQDHLSVDVHHARRGRGPFHAQMRLDRTALNMARAYLLGTGPATVLPSRLHAFLKTRRDLAVPDIQFLFRGAPARAHPWFPGITPAYEDSFGLRPVMLHPESRGVVRLRSSDPSAPVRIVQNFLATEHDVRTIREGVKLGRDIASRKALDTFRGRETAPGPDCRTEAEIDAFVRRTAITAHHPCATCAMGTGDDAVLDPALRVRGVEGLRVADASAMPDLVSGNINACVMMIAEKAADLVLGRPPLPA